MSVNTLNLAKSTFFFFQRIKTDPQQKTSLQVTGLYLGLVLVSHGIQIQLCWRSLARHMTLQEVQSQQDAL